MSNHNEQFRMYADAVFNELEISYKQGWNDAIDEFVELINTMPTYENEYGEIMPMPIKMMAEQLKEQKE